MSGSDRFFDTSAAARLMPYAAPRRVQPAALPQAAQVPKLAPALEPFVAREFRHLLHGGAVLDEPRQGQQRPAGPATLGERGAEVMELAPAPAADFSNDAALHDSAGWDAIEPGNSVRPDDLAASSAVDADEESAPSRERTDAPDAARTSTSAPAVTDGQHALNAVQAGADAGGTERAPADESVADSRAHPISEGRDADPPNAEGRALPSIDEFLEDPEHTDHDWPLGDTAQQLHALRQSLMPADPVREQTRGGARAREGAGDDTRHAAMSVWNDNDWPERVKPLLAGAGDAEPQARTDAIAESAAPLDAANHEPAEAGKFGERNRAQQQPTGTDTAGPRSDSLDGAEKQMNAETAAVLLEALAQRVRSGQLWVPAFQSELADEAVLAGLLASMLGRRKE